MCLTKFKLNKDKFWLHLILPTNLSPKLLSLYMVLTFGHLPRAHLAKTAGLNELPLAVDGVFFKFFVHLFVCLFYLSTFYQSFNVISLQSTSSFTLCKNTLNAKHIINDGLQSKGWKESLSSMNSGGIALLSSSQAD